MLKIESSNFIAEVPYKTLEMIQQANGEQIIFLEMFKLLDKINPELKKDYRVIFIIKEKVYYKTIEESNIRIYESGKFEGLDASCHYIFVMKKYSNMRDVKILAEIKRRLKQHNREFKEISVKNFQIDLFGNLFIIESALKTYLGH